MEKISAVYRIKNRVNGKIYVGASGNITHRQNHHFNALRRGKHDIQSLQEEFDRYGEDAIEWSVIEYVEPKRLSEREQFHCDRYPQAKLYNKRTIVDSNKGVKYSPETRAKMSIAKQNILPETRAKMSAAKKGTKKSPEHIAKIGAANKGRQHSDKTRAKIGFANKGRKQSPESIAKIAKARQKPVLQMDKTTGKIVKKWDSMTIAAKELGTDQSSISACARGKLKSAGGYRWQYAERT